jgi:hypothetical protein
MHAPRLSALPESMIADWVKWLRANKELPELAAHLKRAEGALARCADSDELDVAIRVKALSLAMQKNS